MVDDKVKPNYYKAEGYELDVLDIIEMFNLGFHEGCIIKYLIRWEDKGGIQDLRKAKEYIERMIEWKSTKG